MDKRKLTAMIRILRVYYRNFRTPAVTLISQQYRDPFHVLFSCILSLRTKDQTTNEASKRLFALAPTLTALSEISVKKIEKAIFPAGFYKTKAQRIKIIAHDINTRFAGKIPSTMHELLSLYGVGRKTANLVLALGFNKLGICVDTHVHRISNRFGFVKTKTVFETEMRLRKQLPERYWIEYNDLLVAFGQNICRPLSPFCNRCRLFSFCQRVGVARHR